MNRSILALVIGFVLGAATTRVTASRPGVETPCGWVLWMSTLTSATSPRGVNISPKKWTTVDAADSRDACLAAAAQQIRAVRVRQNVPEPEQEFLETAFTTTIGSVTSTSFVAYRCFPSEARPQ